MTPAALVMDEVVVGRSASSSVSSRSRAGRVLSCSIGLFRSTAGKTHIVKQSGRNWPLTAGTAYFVDSSRGIGTNLRAVYAPYARPGWSALILEFQLGGDLASVSALAGVASRRPKSSTSHQQSCRTCSGGSPMQQVV